MKIISQEIENDGPEQAGDYMLMMLMMMMMMISQELEVLSMALSRMENITMKIIISSQEIKDDGSEQAGEGGGKESGEESSRQGQGGGGETGSMSMRMIREDNVKEIDKPKARGSKGLNFPDGKFQCTKTFQTKYENLFCAKKHS